jgi:hypothetical protein
MSFFAPECLRAVAVGFVINLPEWLIRRLESLSQWGIDSEREFN